MLESWFKYTENVKYDSDGIHRNNGDVDRQGIGDGTGFFSAPLLHVESVTYSEVQVEIGTAYNSDYTVRNLQGFECHIWIIKIHSRNPAFSILNNCHAKAYITTDGGQSTSNPVELPWKNLKDPPTRFVPYTNLTMQDNMREQYKKIFAYYYWEELRRNYVSPTVDIRKGVTNHLYFLLTFKGSSYAYLLTMSEFATWSDNKDVFYGNVDGLSLALPLNNQYTFDILFQGVNVANVNQGGHVQIHLDIKSWNKILLIS
jgi:hypothetical protein